MALTVRLLGDVSVRDEDGARLSLPTRKTWALLGYLAANADRPQSRERLAALLWGDRSDRQARQSLNHALRAIRKLELPGAPPLLATEGEQVALRGGTIDIDIAQFRALLAARPADAAALYEGPFLDGLAIPNPAFNDWLAATRDELHDLACDAHERNAIDTAASGDIRGGIDAARRLIRLDPLRESGHQLLIRLYYEAGDRAKSLRQYRDCAEILQRELDVAPGAATRKLYDAVLRDEPYGSNGDVPLNARAAAPLRPPPFVPPAARRAQGNFVRNALVSTIVIFGLTLVPWHNGGMDPSAHLTRIETAAALLNRTADAAAMPRSFKSAVARDSWYAGAKVAIAQIFNRRLALQESEWKAFGCSTTTARDVRRLCGDIAFEMRFLDQQKRKEISALERTFKLSLVVQPNPAETVADSNDVYGPQKAVYSTETVKPAVIAVPSVRRTGNPMPEPRPEPGIVRSDFADKAGDTNIQPAPKDSAMQLTDGIRLRTAARHNKRVIMVSAKAVAKTPALAETTDEIIAPVLKKDQTNSTTKFRNDHKRIKQAISDYYDITGYTHDYPTSTNGAYLQEITALSLHTTSGEKFQVDARYMAVSIYSNGIRTFERRFTLFRSNGAYRVVSSRTLKRNKI